MATISPSLTVHHILIVPAVVWRVVTSCLPHHDVLEFSNPILMKKNGFAYLARSYTLDESRIVSNRALSDTKWESLVMTGKCDWFCVMMEKVICDSLQDLLGPDTNARWLLCKPKAISILAEERDGTPFLKNHSVIVVTLPDRSQYIFDGTAPQFERPFQELWLVQKHEYEAKYILEARDTPFWEPSSAQKATLQVGFEKADKEYWSAALDYLRVLMKQMDWNSVAKLSVNDIATMVQGQALDDFQALVKSLFSPPSSDHNFPRQP